MSDHLHHKHNVTDQYKTSIDHLTRIYDGLKEDEFIKDNGFYHCNYENCEYSTQYKIHHVNLNGMAHHAQWHRIIKQQNMNYLYPDPDGRDIALYPCPEPSCRFEKPFLHYGALAAHKEGF